MENINRIFKNQTKCITLYLTLGYPSMEEFFRHVDILVEAGMDILEIGIPVTNPCLDGNTIVDTHHRAIELGFNEDMLVSSLKKLRERYPKLPIVILSYHEGINQYHLLDWQKTQLYDLILCPDHFVITRDEDSKLVQIYHEDMSDEVIQERLAHNKGFAYVMSGHGTTGGKGSLPQGYLNTMQRIRNFTDIPIQVGFGIHHPDQVKRVIENGADGVIIGSEIIRIINQRDDDQLKSYVQSIVKARG